MNCLVAWRAVDCFDAQAADFEVKPDRNGKIDYTLCSDPVFDVKRIPEHVRIFRVQGMVMTVLVDAGIKEAIESAGITGPQFRDVRTIG